MYISFKIKATSSDLAGSNINGSYVSATEEDCNPESQKAIGKEKFFKKCMSLL